MYMVISWIKLVMYRYLTPLCEVPDQDVRMIFFIYVKATGFIFFHLTELKLMRS